VDVEWKLIGKQDPKIRRTIASFNEMNLVPEICFQDLGSDKYGAYGISYLHYLI
jgi:hypothetical protein